MKVRFVQSGGVVGTAKGCDLDTGLLGPEAAHELERLVAGSGLAASGRFVSPQGRDLRQFEIEIDAGDRKVSVVFDESELPAGAKALVGFLLKRAKPQPLL